MDGLTRRSVQDCATWAEHYRFMANQFSDRLGESRWSFEYHPWLREMHNSTADENYGQKAAQMGYTEWLLNIAFFCIDVRRWDVLYVLPSKTPDASDFSAARFDAALELSPHLQSMFSDVKNVGHKRAGTANMYLRGSQSKSGLKSVPAGALCLDEYDEMNQDNIPLVKERVSGQFEHQINGVSTPTIDDYGINKEFNLSSKEEFFFKCIKCSRQTNLVFPDCLKITGEDLTDPGLKNSHLICKECKQELPHETKRKWLKDGIWVPARPQIVDVRGFHINQMYSSTIKPVTLARSVLKAQFDPAEEQELHNSKMGLPHIVEGARITDEYINRCKTGHANGHMPPPGALVTMGVDVGRFFHVWIDQWALGDVIGNDINTDAQPKNLIHTKVRDPSELDELMGDFGVQAAVIDAQPERRAAFAFSQRFWGYVWMCFYGRGMMGKQIHEQKSDTGEPIITVDRTSWLDQSLGRFKAQTILMPKDTHMECRQNLKSLVRIFEKDPQGNPVGRYIKATKDDHYAHARNYSEIALPMAMAIGGNQDIRGVV